MGVWGFLYTGKDRATNFGYWDQHYVLRWVHDNIGHFGGDPDHVTLLGYGTGKEIKGKGNMTTVQIRKIQSSVDFSNCTEEYLNNFFLSLFFAASDWYELMSDVWLCFITVSLLLFANWW